MMNFTFEFLRRVQKILNNFTFLYNNRVVIFQTIASMLHAANIYSIKFSFLTQRSLISTETCVHTHPRIHPIYHIVQHPSFIVTLIRSNRLFRGEFPKECIMHKYIKILHLRVNVESNVNINKTQCICMH